MEEGMIKTEYICDKCKASQPTDRQFWKIRVAVRSFEQYGVTTDSVAREEQWCRRCVEDMGLLPTDRPKAEMPPAPATLEDMIREIIREEVSHDR
jgi:hypothetical protein